MLLKPAAAIAAPAKPPISVCEEEEGRPNHQVNKFHIIEAINPDKIIMMPPVPETTSGFTVLATVLATAWSLKIKKATKLKKPPTPPPEKG